MIIPHPHVDFVEVNELTNTERGEGGFGSTGK
jgi:dUTPase